MARTPARSVDRERRQLVLDPPPGGSSPSSAAHTSEARQRRVVRNGGTATNDLVLSAYVAGNEAVLPEILDLYVAPGSTVADVTYGKGVFWRNVPADLYHLLATDLQTGVDCRELPYEDGEIDCVVFDPPYMHTPGGTAREAASTAKPASRMASTFQ